MKDNKRLSMLKTDVIVAGGGIAGLLIATALAPRFSVTLLEQADALPRNKYWLTDARAARDNAQIEACVDTCYNFFDFVAFDGLTATIHGDYCLWDTDALIELLSRRLASNGVRVLTGHRLYTFHYGKDNISVRANSEIIKAKLLIDCMGFGSPIVGAKDVATILGYYVVQGCEVAVTGSIRPIALDNVVINRNPAFFELFPTSKGTAHAAIILPSRGYKTERSLQKEFAFIVTQSHYSEHIAWKTASNEKPYFGIVPVGRLHKPALDRIVFFGEAGQANPAASATGFTRFLRAYRQLASGLAECLETDQLDRRHLLGSLPSYMTVMNRAFQESLFDSILSFNSDQFRRLVEELREYPDHMVNALLFAEYDFHNPETLQTALDGLLRRNSILGKNIVRAIARLCRQTLLP
jgi:flavin-dependent dehydrogenase